MNIAGLQKLTLLDYPGKTACTVFTHGCNFRCPFCHNAPLVTYRPEEPISGDEFFTFLSRRQGILDGVCVTGGEPTLQKELIPFIERIKELGFLLKLDTNGARPDVLKEILARGLADYVAMDIKASPERYAEAVGLAGFDFSLIEESIRLLEQSGIPHEFRTTVTEELHREEDFEKILSLFSENTPYFLQQFKDSGALIDENCHGWETCRMKSLHSALSLQHGNVSLREG